MARSFLLLPCLLICLACATPFPIANLKEGMTTETVREKFGAPTEADLSGDAKSCWTYWHEEREWCSDPPSALWLLDLLLFPAMILSIPVNAALPGVPWDLVYVTRKPVLLDFEEEKLVRWETIEPTESGWECSRPLFAKRFNQTTGQYEDDPFPQEECGPVVIAFPDPPTCTLIRNPWLRGQSEVRSDAIIPTGPQWVFDPSTGHPEPETSCKSERASAEARAEASDTRYVARNYVSLWLEPTASSNEERISVNRGQPLKILARRCGWCRVEDNDGTKGWVGCEFLESKLH
jgi:hypothetical protein